MSHLGHRTNEKYESFRTGYLASTRSVRTGSLLPVRVAWNLSVIYYLLCHPSLVVLSVCISLIWFNNSLCPLLKIVQSS